MLFLRQVRTLTAKNILIVLLRHALWTPLRCFLLPVIFIGFLAYARNLFIPPSHYGIAPPTPVRSLADALRTDGAGRHTVAFVNNGFTGGDIEGVITQVADTVRAEGRDVQILNQEEELLTTCRNSLRGVSQCFGAAVFFASPSEGPGGMWNYSLRGDGGLGVKIDVTNTKNDIEIYPIPLQHAIDFSILSRNSTVDQSTLPSQINEYPFTDKTQQQRNDDIRTSYMGGIIDILGVAFFLGIVGVIYQLVGLIASERENGMTEIIDASMPNRRRWEPQTARLLASHIAFDIMFLPGWIAMALILALGIFTKTNTGLIIVFNILTGLSLSSYSLFGAAFFHKAQLSGIVTTITALLLAVLAQVINSMASTGAVAILSLLFPPMNYTYFIILIARWERKNIGMNLVKSAPENTWTLPGITFFVFSIIHILVFPVLAAWIERLLHGTASKGRRLTSDQKNAHGAVQLSGFTKRYSPSAWARGMAAFALSKRKEEVTAVEGLDLSIPQGQIMVLLGANGSGKSTTLDAIAGLNTVTAGTVTVDGEGGLGICPQRNVLWADLTPVEHVRIFNRLKAAEQVATKAEIHELLTSCDLDRKANAKAASLSGGQKRKLQLSMMFTGGSRVCCVDEASSGIDPIARQKLWNILLNERGKRTIILTTHFLDEADLLSDQIAILSKGQLKAQGSSVELKHRLGGGFRVRVYKSPGEDIKLPSVQALETKSLYDQTIITLPDSRRTADCVRLLEDSGVRNYEISSPTIEEIFFDIAETLPEAHSTTEKDGFTPKAAGLHEIDDVPNSKHSRMSSDQSHDAKLQLHDGRRLSILQQTWTLFIKRWTVFKRNWFPNFAAFLLPVVAAGLVTLFLKNFDGVGCSPSDQISTFDIESLVSQAEYSIVLGPSSAITPQTLERVAATFPAASSGNSFGGGFDGGSLEKLRNSTHIVDTLDEFNGYINNNYANVTPGGVFLGQDGAPPTFAYKANSGISQATITQNMLDTLLTNVSISSQYQSFDIPFTPGAGKNLQLIIYFGLAMSVYPAFFALYPTLERLRHVRQLHYSNGVRSVCLWLAYLSFDSIIVLASSALCTIIFAAASDVWYHVEYLFIIFLLYGIASILLSYVISLFARSQLAAFAFAAGFQAVMFLLYFIAYLSVLTYAPPNRVDSEILIVHFTFSLIAPGGSLIRTMFAALNVFSTLCHGRQIASYPGEITVYGGPILYLIVQSFFLFGVLLWWDNSSLWARLRTKKHIAPDSEAEGETLDDEIAAEVKRATTSTNDGLRVMHATKNFKSNVAVQDVTFGVKRGEVFALLGPNGAGKSTTISLIRGDIRPSPRSGEIFVNTIPLSKHRDLARNSLGVCPQVDACDQMTVLEHLRFYARVRGVTEVEHNVQEVLHAVGLEPFKLRMAAKLSGGNKRKLSLGIALMGNPSVLLLDEPSSGMDVCAKRVMWRTLASILPGRSLVLTTHSMEEADALADRAGILGRRLLALGTSEYLRRKHGNRYHVHLSMKTAPHTPAEDMERVKRWIIKNLEAAEVEDKTFHGQLRFSVPADRDVPTSNGTFASKLPIMSAKEQDKTHEEEEEDDDDDISPHNPTTLPSPQPTNNPQKSGIGTLFTTLETHKEDLGFEYYSVSPTTLDQVFLSIVGKHNIEEENYHQRAERGRKGLWKRVFRRGGGG